MPTVFERLETAMTGNGANVGVELQADNLLNISSTLQSLASNPPGALGDLTSSFGEVGIPDFPLPANFIAQLTDIRAAVPGDASGAISAVLTSIAQVESAFAGEVATKLRQALTAFEKVQALTRIDFTCADAVTGTGAATGSATTGGTSTTTSTSTATTSNQPTAVSGATSQANTALDRFPTPLNVRSLLTFLHDATAFRRDQPMIPPLLPLFDDVRDPLDTLLVWGGLTPAQLRAELVSSVTNATAFVGTGVSSTATPLFTDLNAFAASMSAPDLHRIAERLTLRLGELRTAVQGGDVSGTGAAVAEINSLLDEYDTLRPVLTPVLNGVPALELRLRDLAGDLDAAMARMVSVLRPGGAALARVPNPAAVPLEALQSWLEDVTAWLQQILDALDLSALQQPIADIADATHSAADGLQQAIIGVTVQVQAIFSEVEELLDSVDIASVQTDVEAAIEQFRDQVVNGITSRVAPARAAVHTAISEIDGAVDAFDPQQVIDALTDAVQAIADVLTDADVANAIAQVRDALDQAADQIDQLSFAPVTDAVIGTIDKITEQLSAIDPASIPAPVGAALDAAVSVLPQDLQPVTQPLIVDFDGLVESGPVPVLEVIRAQPARLLESVRKFDPAALIGDQLSGPFNEIVRELERFRPSQLLEPVEHELDSLKQRLRSSASPAQLVQPLQQPFTQLQQAFASFGPDTLISPIDDALSAAMQRLLDVLPIDETFGIIDDALGGVQRAVNSAQDVVDLLQRVRDMMNGLLDARTQMQAWVDEVLAKIDAIGDSSALDAPLSALSAAIDATRAAALTQSLSDGTAALRAALQDVNGATRLAALIQAHRAVPRGPLAALPASAERDAITAALNRFDPLAPDFGAPWQVTGELQTALQEADTEMQTLLGVWDDRFHAAGSSLDQLRQTQATPAQLRTWANDIFQTQLVEPVAAVFGILEPARAVIDAFVQPLETFAQALIDKVNGLLLGPGSLGDIRTALAQIVDQVLNVDLDFLRDSLQSLFDDVQQKLDSINPAQLASALDQSFGEVLDAITIDLILAPADVQELDDTYEEVIDKLRQLDPGEIVTKAVQPVFDEQVLPLLDAFDLSPVIDKVIEKLKNLDGELEGELGRVNVSYQAMLAAVPGGGSQSISVSATVSV